MGFNSGFKGLMVEHGRRFVIYARQFSSDHEKNVPVNCREEARGFHNLAYSRWIPSRPPWPMLTRLNRLSVANVITWLSILHLCKDDLRRTEMGATKGSVTHSSVDGVETGCFLLPSLVIANKATVGLSKKR